MSEKVGIMGGTFDPIHIGHLILGEYACQQFGLDYVMFMPSGNPPHKLHRTGRASTPERVDMVRLAIQENDHFQLSLEEIHDEGYTYTRQTLERLTAAHPDTEYYFIMGADSLLAFDSWKDPDRICALCHLVVAVRNHLDDGVLEEKIREVSLRYHASIQKLETLNIDISSETLRSWVKEGRSIRYYVPDPVVRYIQEKKLYVPSTDKGMRIQNG